MDWGGSNGLVVVWKTTISVWQKVTRISQLTSIVTEHSSEVANNVDDEEDSSLLRLHGQVASTSISRNGMGSCSFNEQVKNGLGRSKNVARGIGGEGEDQDDDQKHHSVNVIREEGCLDTTEHGVDDNTNWKQETSCNSVLVILLDLFRNWRRLGAHHASERADDSSTAGQQHSCHENIGHDAEHSENPRQC